MVGIRAGTVPATRLAELGWLATKRTGWMLRRSTTLMPYLVVMAVRELYARPSVAAEPEDWRPRQEDGMGVVVDLAAYRMQSQSARAARMIRDASSR